MKLFFLKKRCENVELRYLPNTATAYIPKQMCNLCNTIKNETKIADVENL